MSGSSGICRSFRQEILDGIHDMDTDIFKVALYVPPANITPLTTAYSASNETTGSGYTAGGFLVAPIVTFDADNVLVQLPQISQPNCTFMVETMLMYNVSKGNRAVCAFYLGSVRQCTSGLFEVNWPQPTFTLSG